MSWLLIWSQKETEVTQFLFCFGQTPRKVTTMTLVGRHPTPAGPNERRGNTFVFLVFHLHFLTAELMLVNTQRIVTKWFTAVWIIVRKESCGSFCAKENHISCGTCNRPKHQILNAIIVKQEKSICKVWRRLSYQNTIMPCSYTDNQLISKLMFPLLLLMSV